MIWTISHRSLSYSEKPVVLVADALAHRRNPKLKKRASTWRNQTSLEMLLWWNVPLVSSQDLKLFLWNQMTLLLLLSAISSSETDAFTDPHHLPNNRNPEAKLGNHKILALTLPLPLPLTRNPILASGWTPFALAQLSRLHTVVMAGMCRGLLIIKKWGKMILMKSVMRRPPLEKINWSLNPETGITASLFVIFFYEKF